jgi:hypothetical protein
MMAHATTAEPEAKLPVAVASVMVKDQHVHFGSYIYGPGSIAAVGLDDAGSKIEVWPIVCAAALAFAGFGLFWKVLDPLGWIIGTGMLLAATALCLCSKSFLYRLTITGADGAQQSALSPDRLELDELRALIQRRLTTDATLGGADVPNRTVTSPGFNILT